LKEENCCFLNKELWNYTGLRADMAQNLKTHASQYLNNPVLAAMSDFLRADLIQATLGWTSIPRGRCFTTIDLAYSDKKGRDYTVMAVGDFHDDALYIRDIIRDRYRPEQYAPAIIQMIVDYNPERIGIEHTNGSDWLEQQVRELAYQRGVQLPPIDMISLGAGVDASKETRIRGLGYPLKHQKLFFDDRIECLEELYSEFVKCSVKGAKKDIPDAISRLWETYAPVARQPTSKEQRVEDWKKQREKDQYDMIFQQGKFAYRQPEIQQLPESKVDTDPYTGLPNGSVWE